MEDPLVAPGPDRLLPLLRSIAREVDERSRDVVRMEMLADALSISPRCHGDEIAELRAGLASHRRELRRCVRELARLGCSVEDIDPLRIRVPNGDEGDRILTFRRRVGAADAVG